MGGCCIAHRQNKCTKAFMVRFLVAFFSLINTNLWAAPGEELVDEIVAIVNANPILHSDVESKVKGGQLVLVSDFPSNEKSPEYERAMNDLINFELIMDKVDELEITITEEELESQIEEVLKNQNLTRESLTKYLEQEGKNLADYKADFKKQMMLRRFQGRVVAPLIKVTDKEIQTFYLKKSGAKSDALKLTLRQILIKVPSDASDAVKSAKKSLSDEVYQKLSGGMEFEEAVKIYSDAPDARANGGMMKNISLADLSDQIRTPVEALTESQYTTPIVTPLGYHIFYLVEKSFSGSDEFVAQKQQLEYELRTVELNNQTRRWIQENRQKAKVEILKK